MNKSNSIFGKLLILIFIAFIYTSLAESENINSKPIYYFAISNTDGSKFLIYENKNGKQISHSDRDELKYAIHKNKIYKIKFSNEQGENLDKNNGLHTNKNFHNLPGLIFTNLNGNIPIPDYIESKEINNSILLVNEAFLKNNKIIEPLYEVNESPGREFKKKITKKFKRKTVSAEISATFGENGENSFIAALTKVGKKDISGLYLLHTKDGKFSSIEYPLTEKEIERKWMLDDYGYFRAPLVSAVFKNNGEYVFFIEIASDDMVKNFIILQKNDKLIEDEYHYKRVIAKGKSLKK